MTNEDLAMSLRQRFFELKKQRKAALETAENILDEMKRVRAAYRALSGEEGAGADDVLGHQVDEERSVAAAPPKEIKRTLASEDIRQRLLGFLLDGPCEFGDLNKRIGDVAVARDVSRKGLHFRVRTVLKDGPFVEKDGKWMLEPKGAQDVVGAGIHRLLEEEGSLAEPQLRSRLQEKVEQFEQVQANFEEVFKKVLHDGPYVFNGAAWGISEEPVAQE